MRPNDTYDHFEAEFSYPIDREDVIEAVGETALTPPRGAPESIGEVLGRAEATTFHCPRELFETLTAHLGEQYVGRKFYDDRGPNVGLADTR
ncbi:MAG: hypothetical protein ABEH77_10670 [Halobacteriaceae archaeon]